MSNTVTRSYLLKSQAFQSPEVKKNKLVNYSRISPKDSISFGSAAAASGMMVKISKAATELIIKINNSRLPGPIKSWTSYMIANVPILSNIVFKSPITEGDLIFATAAALPFARTISETKDRRREAFLRDMSGFVIFLACVRAVQGFEWEKYLGFMKQAKPLIAYGKDQAVSSMNMLTRMFPDTQKLLAELARVDKVDDIIRAAMKSGSPEKVLSEVFKNVDPAVKKSAIDFFKRVPRAKEHFVKSLEAAANNGNGLKRSFANFNNLKNFRSVAGAIIGGIAYVLISGIGINKLNQYLAKRDKARAEKLNKKGPQGIPFSAKMNELNKVNQSAGKTVIIQSQKVIGGNPANREAFMKEFNAFLELVNQG